MVYGTSNGELFHYEGCMHIKKIREKNLISFKTQDDARESGYHCCNKCSRLIKYYSQDRCKIDRYIKKHHMQMYIKDDAMYIENGSAAWKIIVDENYALTLYHANTENYSKLKKDHGKIIHHYHKQKYRYKREFLTMLEYIVDHDSWKKNNECDYKNLPKRTKKQKKAYKNEKIKSQKMQVFNVRNLIEKLRIEREENENNQE